MLCDVMSAERFVVEPSVRVGERESRRDIALLPSIGRETSTAVSVILVT